MLAFGPSLVLFVMVTKFTLAAYFSDFPPFIAGWQ